MKILEGAVNTLLPPRCYVTGRIVPVQGTVSPEAWGQLDFIQPPFCKLCGMPFSYEIEGDILCSSCLEERPLYTSARSALRYNEVSKDLILGFKYADKTHYRAAFAPWLLRAGSAFLKEDTLLLPVPLHHGRLVKRRYNQSALLVQVLAKHSPAKPLYNVLRRHRATQCMGDMSHEERAANVKDAFHVPAKYYPYLEGCNVVLVDDVYTTGTTVLECTKALLNAGVAEVHVLTLARVVYNT